MKASRDGRPGVGVGGYVLRCAAQQGVPCTTFVTEGDCDHTRAVVVREEGGFVKVLDALREELRQVQVENEQLRLELELPTSSTSTVVQFAPAPAPAPALRVVVLDDGSGDPS